MSKSTRRNRRKIRYAVW